MTQAQGWAASATVHKRHEALVLREVAYKEHDKILTVLTASEGKMTVGARGARKTSCRYIAATQLLSYGSMTVFEYKGKVRLDEAELIEGFLPLRKDLVKMSLGAYIAEICEALSPEGDAVPELLSVTLNTLSALSGATGKPDALIKGAGELKLMSVSGYEPSLDACAVCGNSEMLEPALHLHQGEVHCRDCRAFMPSGGVSMPLGSGALSAMRYVVHGNPKKLFSFSLEGSALELFSQASEAYVHAQLERGFSTLDFYKKL